MVVRNILLAFIIVSSLAQADIFKKGKSSFGVSLGAGSSYNNTYTLVGLSGNYFVVDNLSLGLSYRGWFGADPIQNELALATNYFIPISKKFRPYVGAFVRETLIDGYDNRESFGARGGVAMITNNSYVSLGYAYEQFSSCLIKEDCSTSYPEIVFGLSF
ncbi:MAG: hypothetical protein U9O86_08380 [Campylobacterota bacterium]|nr:hypothetical protein [Campylobacterota bacterium]